MEIRNILKLNDSKLWPQNLWNIVEVVCKWNFIALNPYIRKEEKVKLDLLKYERI